MECRISGIFSPKPFRRPKDTLIATSLINRRKTARSLRSMQVTETLTPIMSTTVAHAWCLNEFGQHEQKAEADQTVIELVVRSLEGRICDDHRVRSFMPHWNGKTVPISISSFVHRIVKYGCNTPCCFVSALIFLDRFQSEVPEFRLSPVNYQRFVLVSCLIASKFLEDRYYRC